MTLLLLRHGESEGNILRMIQGWHDYPLTERGHQQAEYAAVRLATAGASALYTSPLRRAADTAAAVARTTGLVTRETPDFREYCFGEAQGMRWADAAVHADDLAICVLHAGTIGAIVEYLCGLPLHEHAALYTGNCGIAVIEHVGGAHSIVTLNDQRHLPVGVI